jgi:hypothetical protein
VDFAAVFDAFLVVIVEAEEFRYTPKFIFARNANPKVPIARAVQALVEIAEFVME